MKKAPQIDISKPNVRQDEIINCLNQYYEWIKDHPAHQLKLSKKNKALKMVSNINAMIVNNSSNIDPFLHDVATVLNYFISPIVEPQVHQAAVHCLCSLISVVNQNYESDIYITIDFMFLVPSDFEKKAKGAKLESTLNESYSALLNGLENAEDLHRQIVWCTIFFDKILPTIQRTKQPESVIIKWMSMFVKTVSDLFVKASVDNTLDQYLRDDASFIIFRTLSILPVFYKTNDRDLAINFYHILFSSTFYYIDCDMSCTKFGKKKDLLAFFDERCSNSWGGPEFISNLYSQSTSFLRRLIHKFITPESISQNYIVVFGPILESLLFKMSHLKDEDFINNDIADIYITVLRLRNAMYLAFSYNQNKHLVDTSLRCLLVCTMEMNPLYKEFLPFTLSLYLTLLFDTKYSDVKDIHDFVQSLINIDNARGSQNRNLAPQICVHVTALITITLAPFLLDLSRTERQFYLTNSLGIKNANKPISIHLMRRIVTNSIYFFFKILGCDFSEFVSSAESTQDNSKSEADWDKEKATQFIMNIIDAIDPIVDYTVSATVADNLMIICHQTIVSNPDIICKSILPRLFNAVLNKDSNLYVILPVLRRVVRTLFDCGYMNTSMANDWFRVIQKYIFHEKGEVSNEMLYGAANSITRGYQYSTSMIPLFIAKVFENASYFIAYGHHVNLICTCLVNIIMITKNTQLFKNDIQKSIELIFNNNQKFLTIFMTFLNSPSGLSQICLSIFQKICEKISKNELPSIENLIILLFFNDAMKATEKVNPIIENILINIFFKPENFSLLSSEFYSILFLLTNYYNKLVKKCPNLYTKLFETVFLTLVNGQNLSQKDFKRLLSLSTDYILFNSNEENAYQFMSILSAPAADQDHQKILNDVFDFFVLNYHKPNDSIKTLEPDLMVFQKSRNIFIHHFKGNNQVETHISRKNVSAQYSLTFKRSKNSSELSDSSDIEKFLSTPSLGLIYELLAESSGESIRALSGDDNRLKIKKVGLLTRNALSRQQRVLVETSALFIGHNQLNRDAFLMNTENNISQDFCRFLSSLGNYYSATHIPFLPNFTPSLKIDVMNDETVVCWSNLRNDVVCSILPLMKPLSEEERWKRVKNLKILIIWNENAEQINLFNQGFLTEGIMEVAFVLRPFTNSLIQISIIKKTKKMPVFGFFKKTMLLPANIVGFCISNMICLADEFIRDDIPPIDWLKGYNEFYTKALIGDMASFNPS